MKIVIETTAHPGGGSITYLEQLLSRLAGTADDYTVIVPAGRDALTEPGADNVTFAETSFPVGNVVLREVYRQLVLPLLLLGSDADGLFSTGDVTSLLAPIPTVVLVHNLSPYARSFGMDVGGWRRLRNAIHRTMTRLSIHQAMRVIWVSRFMADAVGGRFGVPERKGAVIHHGVATGRFKNPSAPNDAAVRETVEQHQPFLLTVSTVNPHKNYEALLEAFTRLPAEHRERYGLLIVGRHPNEEYLAKLRARIKDEGLEDSVTFLGGVSHDVVPYLYACADIYVLPSRVESFGMTPLEAMAASTPVVATDATAIPEICGDAAQYFDPEDPADLAQRIAEVLDDPARQEELVAAGRERVEDFDWDETASKTEALLRRVAEGE